MTEREMTLATDWDFRSLWGWYCSEKLDGVRAYWDGACIWTRGGRSLDAPKWFTRQLPAGIALDGELWAGYNTLTVAANAAVHGIWDERLVFRCFDFPSATGDWMQRMAQAEPFNNGLVQCVERGVVGKRDDPSSMTEKIIARGGEGMMFRHPDVRSYQRKRTVNLMRIKARNLFPPWQPILPALRKLHNQRADQAKHQPAGFEFGRLAFNPELEWKVHLAMSQP